MQRIVLLLSLALTFSAAACQPQTVILPTITIPPTPTALPDALPTVAPTATLGPTASSAPIDTPVPAPTPAPACLVMKGTPLTFLKDDAHLLYRGEKGIQLLNLQTKESEEFLPEPSPPAQPGPAIIALSPAGDRLAWALSDNTIQVYQTADKKLLHTLRGHKDIITELEFSPDGEKLYSASHDTWVLVWNRDGKQVGGFQPTGAGTFPNEVLGMGLSADGKMLATIPFDGKTRIWDAANFSMIHELPTYGGYENSDAVFSPDGQYLAAVTANGLFLWKTLSGEQILGGNPGINAMAMAFSPDGRYFVYWDIQANNEITVLTEDASKTVRTLQTSGLPIFAILFSPDGSLMVAGSDAETRIWRAEDGELLYIGKPECS